MLLVNDDCGILVVLLSFFTEVRPREKARPRSFYVGKYFRSDVEFAPSMVVDGEIAGSNLWLWRWRVACTACPSLGRFIFIC